jgi:hypothetical protein
MRRRLVALLLLAALEALAARAAAAARDRHAPFSAAVLCGVERWTVKTLQDRPRLLRKRPTTVAHLTGPAKARPPAPHAAPRSRSTSSASSPPSPSSAREADQAGVGSCESSFILPILESTQDGG